MYKDVHFVLHFIIKGLERKTPVIKMMNVGGWASGWAVGQGGINISFPE